MTKIYSHSRLSTFEQCSLKYKFKYIDKIKPLIEKTIEAHLGSSVHSALEWLYNSLKENSSRIPSIDELLEKYIEEWEKNFSKDILVVKNNMSYSDYFNKGIQFLVNYFTMHHPFRDGTIECEKQIFIELDENTKIQGFIDRLVHNIEKGHYEIHDYKTANQLPTQEKMDEDRQLALYSIAIKELFGKDKEVILVWHYLAHNQKIISKRSNLQLENLKKETLELIKRIESTNKFPPNPSALCGWCEYKQICPVWNKRISEEDLTKIERQSDLKDFPTTKKYIVDKSVENPADKDGFGLDIF